MGKTEEPTSEPRLSLQRWAVKQLRQLRILDGALSARKKKTREEIERLEEYLEGVTTAKDIGTLGDGWLDPKEPEILTTLTEPIQLWLSADATD